jgi:hypothetical protein
LGHYPNIDLICNADWDAFRVLSGYFVRQDKERNKRMSHTTQTSGSKGLFASVFLDHPATVNESYFQHMRFALGFAFWLAVAGLAALVHAIIPAACETTASRILRRLVAKMDARH